MSHVGNDAATVTATTVNQTMDMTIQQPCRLVLKHATEGTVAIVTSLTLAAAEESIEKALGMCATYKFEAFKHTETVETSCRTVSA